MKNIDHITNILYQKLKVEKVITCTELANKLGVSQPAVNRWLNGSTFDITKVPALCEIFDITPNQLFGYDDSLTDEQQRLLRAYEDHPEFHESIKTLLNLK